MSMPHECPACHYDYDVERTRWCVTCGRPMSDAEREKWEESLGGPLPPLPDGADDLYVNRTGKDY